jgi:hypothetical protein
MSLLNIVIRIYGVLSVEREAEDKITMWCQQAKRSDEHLIKFPINCRLYLTYIHVAAHNRFHLFSFASPR